MPSKIKSFVIEPAEVRFKATYVVDISTRYNDCVTSNVIIDLHRTRVDVLKRLIAELEGKPDFYRETIFTIVPKAPVLFALFDPRQWPMYDGLLHIIEYFTLVYYDEVSRLRKVTIIRE